MTPEEVLEATLQLAQREKAPALGEDEARAMARRAIEAAEAKKKPRAYGAFALAAVALLCVLAGFALATLSRPQAALLVQKRESELSPAGGGEPTELAAVSDAERTETSGAEPGHPERAEASADVRLPTGDRLLSANGSHYEVVSTDPDRVVSLGQGDVLFDIESIAGGSFVVNAGDTEVRVLGTVFSVRRTEVGVAVLVFEGRVAVSDASGERVLGAGEFWASDRTLVDDVWREASEARWEALLSESATGLAQPEPRAPDSTERDDADRSNPEPRSEPDAVRALLLQREYRDVLVLAEEEMRENGRSVEWTVVAADAYRGLQEWESAADAYRAAASLARSSRRAQLGYAAAQIYADRLHRPRVALEVLEAASSVSTESIVEERARSLQIRLLQATHQDASLRQAVDAYLERFPDTYTARRLRTEN